MYPPLHRRTLLRASVAAGIVLVAPAARPCEFFALTLRVTHPWTRATPAGATSAIVCMKFDEVTRADRLVRVETEVATGAEMGGAGAGPVVDFAIPQGRESLLSEAGTYLRLVGLRHPLEMARTYPLTLVFESGGIVVADLSVDYA